MKSGLTVHLLLLWTLASGGPVLGQWSPNAGANLAIGDKNGEQNQAKVRPTADGGVYISWFDNSAGGYDVYLQRLNAAGVEQWAHNGVLIADRSFSSTQDYGLAVDAAGNALITYRDDRAGGIQIGVNKVSPAGQLLWGANGVLVTNTADFVASPKVTATSDGFVVVAWTQGPSTVVQKLDANGVPQWSPAAVVTPASGTYTATDVVPGDAGSVIVGMVKGTQRHLHAQKLSAAGLPLWGASPAVVFDGSALQFGYFPSFLPDGAGGAVFAWYETGGPRNVYAQRISSAGAEVFAHNGVAVSTNTSIIRLSPGFSYNEATGEIFVFWTDSNAVQSMWGLSGQKISAAGARAWGDAAVTLIPLSGMQNAFVKSVISGDGAMAFCFDRSGPAQVLAMRVDGATGAFTWAGSPRVVCSVLSGKARLDACAGGGVAKLVWGDARTDVNDIYAQNVNADGSLGPAPCYPDCNGDGALNLGDFGCFQTKFALGDPYADCNGDSLLNLGDFGCFLTRFALGCP